MTNEDTSTYTGDWISWFAGLCNTTFISADDFYSCVETQHLYTKQEIVFNHSSFSFVTARPVGLFNITWEDFEFGMEDSKSKEPFYFNQKNN